MKKTVEVTVEYAGDNLSANSGVYELKMVLLYYRDYGMNALLNAFNIWYSSVCKVWKLAQICGL